MVAAMSADVVKHPSAKRRRKPLPPAPSHLDEEAKQEWRRVAPVLADRGDLGPETLATLETYCTQFARWRAAELGLPAERVFVLSDGAAPPPGSLVFGRFQECDVACDEIDRWGEYWLARARAG